MSHPLDILEAQTAAEDWLLRILSLPHLLIIPQPQPRRSKGHGFSCAIKPHHRPGFSR